MRARGNQLLIQILLMIIITVIVAYTCMNLAELVNMYSEAIGKAIMSYGRKTKIPGVPHLPDL